MRSNIIAEYVDHLIRKTSIGSNLSRIREIAPGLYARLRNIYSRLFRIDSVNDLARYQIRAVRRCLTFAPNEMLNKGVLEIGSDLDAKVIRELHALGCPRVVGANPAFTEEDLARFNPTLPAGCLLQRADMRNTGLPDESFGVLFSVSVFEHLLEFERCLSEMFRILVPGGVVYAEFGPVWSSGLGHHVFANVNEERARHWDPRLNPLKNHSHLLLSHDEMSQYLEGKVSKQLSEQILDWIYEREDINRLFYEDYLRIIEQSPFEVAYRSVDRQYIPEETLAVLRVRHPNYHDFAVRNVELVLRKPL
ncbi:MAG: class I SAM-dependent methyltransferase [Porticoccus sp.]|uniref:class I SAM-dependent methyltransferase n=1 Tax=Porticoccus sp. TaxID=2024853 RepID=UPI003296E8FE